MRIISDLINAKILWGPASLIFISYTGMLLSVRSGFVQLRQFAPAVKNLFCVSDGRNRGDVLRSFFTSLGGSIGIGNISGVCFALAAGGPGSIFWMIFSSFFGMALKYSENVLGVKYRRQENGVFKGGPMYYMGEIFSGKTAGVLFALSGVLVSFGMGNMSQSAAMISSVRHLCGVYGMEISSVLAGAALSVVIYICIKGGFKRISGISTVTVPLMSVVFIFMCAAVLIKNIRLLPGVCSLIFKNIFSLKAASAGISKAVFSNEAGLGTSAIAHACAPDGNIEAHGKAGIIEVFTDTVLMCTVTALTVLVCPEAGVNELSLAAAWNSFFPAKAASFIYAVCVILFACSSMLPWAHYGESCFSYLFGRKYSKLYIIIFAAFTFLGAVMNMTNIMILSDTFNGIMMLINVLALYRFRREPELNYRRLKIL